MTEELSTLDRSQLQKLLQYAVQVDPAAVLSKVFKHIGASVTSALLVCEWMLQHVSVYSVMQ